MTTCSDFSTENKGYPQVFGGLLPFPAPAKSNSRAWQRPKSSDSTLSTVSNLSSVSNVSLADINSPDSSDSGIHVDRDKIGGGGASNNINPRDGGVTITKDGTLRRNTNANIFSNAVYNGGVDDDDGDDGDDDDDDGDEGTLKRSASRRRRNVAGVSCSNDDVITKDHRAHSKDSLFDESDEAEEEDSKSDEHNVSSFTIQKLPSWSGSSASQDEYGEYSSQVQTLDDIKFADEDGDEEDEGQDRRNGNLNRGINVTDMVEEGVDAASKKTGVPMSRVTGAEEAEEEEEGDEGRRPLPVGWEAHEDEDGAYYWHIKSGTIQRDFPVDLMPQVSLQRIHSNVSFQSWGDDQSLQGIDGADDMSQVPLSPLTSPSNLPNSISDYVAVNAFRQDSIQSLSTVTSSDSCDYLPPSRDANTRPISARASFCQVNNGRSLNGFHPCGIPGSKTMPSVINSTSQCDKISEESPEGKDHLVDFENHALKFASESLKKYTSSSESSVAPSIGFRFSQSPPPPRPEETSCFLRLSDESTGASACDTPISDLDSELRHLVHRKQKPLKTRLLSPTSSSSSAENGTDENGRKSLGSAATGRHDKRKDSTDVLQHDTDDSSESPSAIRFAVRSLGWVRINEEDLTPERSSKAVNKCIVDLSHGKNDLLDVVGRWGDGKDLWMDLDNTMLRLIDPQDGSLLHQLPIHSIRVWGVGRDNGRERDFAYVARDRITRKYLCHVFRCETPARTIANALRDICRRIMLERSLTAQTQGANGTFVAQRPNHLPTGESRLMNGQCFKYNQTSNFPTPMEEPRKVIRAHYLGAIQVPKPTGMDVLHPAIDKLSTRVPPERWQLVDVAIAPSTIKITEGAAKGRLIEECRVRYLSFMGIGHNVKLCAFIMHTPEDTFLCHVFHCDPSAGVLCKTVEAACKLRYQKCLDAHRQSLELAAAGRRGYRMWGPVTCQSGHQGRGIGSSLKAGFQNIFSGFRSRKGSFP